MIKKHRILVIMLTLLILIGFASLVKHRVGRVYFSTIGNSELISAVETHDTAKINSLSTKLGIKFTEFKEYKQSSKSDSSLPDVSPISYQEILDSGVIAGSTFEYLSQNKPYLKWYKNRIWEIIPIFPINSDGNGYIIFRKVIL